MTNNPDIILLDYKMPYMDGQSLLDWISPKVTAMEKTPIFILISSYQLSGDDLLHSNGIINKSEINDPDSFNAKLNNLIDP
jgi:CheY-like chemotaxis protein